MNFGISFDFWNTLYGNGDEPERHNRRIRYFYNLISTYIDADYSTIEKAFKASTKYFLHEWQNNFRTPTAHERIQLMSDKLSVTLKENDIEKTADYFGNLIFSVPPEFNPINLEIVRQLSNLYPIGLISDTGYISGKYIRKFLTEQDMISPFSSLVFSDEQPHCKPHNSVFNLTCKNLNVPCSHLIHIGDLEKTDIKGAIEAGGFAIRYIGWNSVESDRSLANYVVDNYKKLSQTITEIVNR